MRLFRLKKRLTTTSLLEGMTDLHTHLLPGVDDGVRQLEESVACLAYMKELGVRTIFLTPHIMDEYAGNTRESLTQAFHALQTVCPEGIDLRLAGEYMLDSGFLQRIKDGLLPLDGKQVLVETSYLSAHPNYQQMLYELSLEGYRPVIAHPERYLYMEREEFFLLKEKGYCFQLNLFSLAGIYGEPVYRQGLWLLKEGLYDYIGSDIHQLERYRKYIERMLLTPSQLKELDRLKDYTNAVFIG